MRYLPVPPIQPSRHFNLQVSVKCEYDPGGHHNFRTMHQIDAIMVYPNRLLGGVQRKEVDYAKTTVTQIILKVNNSSAWLDEPCY